jgi:N-acetylglucosamine kinase-like BadF-type ATPase
VERSGPFTTLTSRVQERFQLAQFREVIEAVYSGKISQSEIASLAKIVSEAAAEDNDEPAAKILMRAGGSLAKLALTVHNALFSDDAAAYPIIAAGSLWNAGPGLTDVFMRTVSRFAPNATVQISEIPPARGAVMKAIANLSS